MNWVQFFSQLVIAMAAANTLYCARGSCPTPNLASPFPQPLKISCCCHKKHYVDCHPNLVAARSQGGHARCREQPAQVSVVNVRLGRRRWFDASKPGPRNPPDQIRQRWLPYLVG